MYKSIIAYTTPEGQSSGSWNFASSIIGATSGGSKTSIIPEITKVEIDGVLVSAKGLQVKTGENAKMEINFAELTKESVYGGNAQKEFALKVIENCDSIIASK